MSAVISDNSSINILVVYHSQTGHTGKMAEAVAEGAGSIKNVNVILKKAGDATLEDLLSCHGLAIGTPEYFGYMSGMIKDFFDRTYEKGRKKKEMFKKPYVVFISAGNDGTGASYQIDRICKGYNFKKVSEPVISRGDVTPEDIKKCYELGQLIAAGCDMRIF
ncbi:MAG: flavodoxin [Candidatus Aminicenantes bacterium]|nr:flavodoxin [Candidatus Aminicenantes bacterium]NIM78144.1 flavodoxin [Candidatus Aminicenantes bacterium]NIN17468.1 flavodoxin [Candidatus Aminicenantes bacterium]NIN41364.1 flavodoxin [Candidatus Aminicenantes bacterium]NIN84130.1 flavodoxin [Candidatus Aminicenantes bacterium]